MKKFISAILCLTLLLSLTLPVYAAADSADVQKTIIALGIMSGDGNGNLNLGSQVTRAEFAKMMVSASVYKDTVQQGSGSSPFKDVKYTHWAADYIKATVDAKWTTGYVDGTFRPDNSITLEEAASAILKMLGYTAADLTGTYPQAQISKFKSLKLDTGISPVQGRALTRNECMYIFYNLMGATAKDGKIYGTTLGYTMNSSGMIDYDALVKADIEGPFIIKDSTISSVIPFSIESASVYRNNKAASPVEIVMYDVVYYNIKTKTVWAYSNRALGVLTNVAPNAVSPESIIVAGNNYMLGSSAAKAKVSASGSFTAGDTVALLLGMNGDVADVIPASEVDGTYCGIVTKIELSTYAVDSSKSRADYVLSVACTDGVIRQCAVDNSSYSAGSLVSFSYSKGELTVKRLSSGSLSGNVDSLGKRLGERAFASDIEILDISSDGSWMTIYPSRLAGVSLNTGKIRYYSTNDKNEIDRLILNDVTGDMYSYGVLTSIQATESTPVGGGLTTFSGSYRYVINGVAGVLNTSNTKYNVGEGPAIFYYTNGQISGMKNLTGVPLSELTSLTATSSGVKYQISDNVQVYIRSSGNCLITELAAVNTADYNLTGYYEDIYPAGGQIRVITAVKK